MMEELFWEVLKHFQNSTAHFGQRDKGLPRRFKKAVSAIDSSTIALISYFLWELVLVEKFSLPPSEDCNENLRHFFWEFVLGICNG